MHPTPKYLRRVIRITADQSPNIRYAQAQIRAGLVPDGTQIIDGVIGWNEYCKRRKHWDPVRACIGLDAQFYEGSEALLFPALWLNACEARAASMHQGGLNVRGRRRGKAIGCDPAEGGNNTAWSVIDHDGLIHQVSIGTPNTAVIRATTLALAREYEVPFDMIMFDRGGGGKQIADSMREDGYPVRTVAFGEPPSVEPHSGLSTLRERKEVREDRTTYVSKRAQMYSDLSTVCNPDEGPVFGIPAQYMELRRQLAVMPKQYDKNGKLRLPPKHKSLGVTEVTLEEMLGCSPDEADSLVIALHCLLYARRATVAGTGAR